MSGLASLALASLACASALATSAQIAPTSRPALEGQIVVDRAHPAWLRYEGAGPHFLAGAGDPEDFLYRGTRRDDGTRDGDQLELIAKLKGTGVNGIYFQVVRSHGGDGDKFHNPFIAHDPARGLNEAILGQWETWFTALDDAGIVIYFFFYDDSASVWDTGDVVGKEEREFVTALVDRFEHHRHLVWVIAEEYQEALSATRVTRLAEIVRAADDHGHVIGVHKLSGLKFKEFADDPNIDQFTMQLNKRSAAGLHADVVRAWRRAAGRFNLNMSEAPDYGTGETARKKSWAIATAGAYVMVLKMDIASTSESDLRDLGRLRHFMESTNFNEMAPHDELAYAGTEYVLADPGRSYIAYAGSLPSGGFLGLRDLAAGRYELNWFDAIDGKRVEQDVLVPAGDQRWQAPDGFGPETAVHVRRTADE